MNKLILFFTLLCALEIHSDFVNDNYYDLINCMSADPKRCSSIKLNTNGLECCNFKITYADSKYDDDDTEICSSVFTKYVSQSMMKQIESIAIEDYGILKAYADIDIPRLKEKITCSSATATYEFGGYTYTSSDLQKLKSENHCLYYYYNSIQRNLFTKSSVSISKDLCINAESLDVTKNADIYCAYAEVAILYSDNTKTEFKTCYFLPSESIKTGQLDPTTEAALKGVSDNQASKSNKVVSEYEAKLVDKNGRSITYNSNKGIVASSNSKYFSICFSKIVIFGLFLLL